jgi:hypothetical protein
MRCRGTQLNVLLAVGVALAVGAVFVFRGGTPSSGSPASVRSVAEGFAGAWLRYLDGRIPLSQLPDADAGVLRTANGVVIPARLRAGQLTLAQLQVSAASGSTASAAFGGRDRKHYFPTTISLARRGGEWEVVGLVPPDMSILYPPPRTPRAPSAAQRAASQFALAYADFRAGERRDPPPGAPLIVKEITDREDPLAHTPAAHTAAHVLRLELGPVTNGTVTATALLGEGRSTVTFLFTMQKEGGLWVASQFILSR